MVAVDLLRHLRAAGVRIALLRDARIETRGRVPAELAQRLRAHREADDLHRLTSGLGDEIDALLWSVLGRLDRPHAERCWRHAQRALADDVLSRLVGWVRSLANATAEQGDVLLAGGPRAHGHHDVRPRADT